jgi:hypothetical protein
MSNLFVSHSSQDDDFVHALQRALGGFGVEAWIDSRELRPGDALWPEIEEAINKASAYAVVISPASLQSDWVGDELEYALRLQKARGKDKLPVIPLCLDETKLGAFKQYFGKEPMHVSVSSRGDGVQVAVHHILVAMGKRLPTDLVPAPQPQPEPLEELVLHLTDLGIFEQDGVRRASARASLAYEPAAPGQPTVESAESWRLVAPIGPIEAEELRWYLEKYAVWPSDYFRERVRKVEANHGCMGQAPLPGRSAHRAQR